MPGPGRVAALRELDAAPACPWELEHVWRWFTRLLRTRSGMGGGIPETEIEAFFRNRKITPQPWELEAIAALDALSGEAESDQE